MAIINAAANGLWSSTSTWTGGVLPGINDDVYANNRTVYIDQDVNVLSINTTAGTGGVAGGSFYNTTGAWSLTARIIPGTTNCLTLTGNDTFNIVSGLITGSATTTNTWGVIIPGSLTPPNVTINAYVTGGSFAGTTGGIRQEAGTISLTGTLLGGSANSTCPAVYIINVGSYPVTFTGYGTAIGGTLVAGAAGLNVNYITLESSKNSSVTFYGTVSGSNLRATANNVATAAIRCNTTIPVNIYGDIIGGSGGPSPGLSIGQSGLILEGSSTVNVYGNVYSGVAGLSGCGNLGAINAIGASTYLNIVGDIINTDTLTDSVALRLASTTGVVNITGNIVPNNGTRNTQIVTSLGGANTLTLYGDISGGRGPGLSHTGNANLYAYGNVYGGNAATAPGIVIQSNARGNMNIYGTVTPGTSSFCHGIAYGIGVISAVFAKKLKGNSYGVGVSPAQVLSLYAVGPNQNVNPLPTFNVVCEELEFGPYGQPPVLLNVRFLDKNNNTITLPLTSTSPELKTLVSPNSGSIMPPASSVRVGVNFSGDQVGTCNIPAPEDVEYGVLVDGSVGMVALRPSNIWNTLSTQLTSLSTTVGYKLNNAATSETVGQLVAAFGA